MFVFVINMPNKMVFKLKLVLRLSCYYYYCDDDDDDDNGGNGNDYDYVKHYSVFFSGRNNSDVEILINDQRRQPVYSNTSLMASSLSENDITAMAEKKIMTSYQPANHNLGMAEIRQGTNLRHLDRLPPIDDIRRMNGFPRRMSMPVGKYSDIKMNKAHVLPIMSASDNNTITAN